MGPGGFFPTNPDLADILGRTDFDFENFCFLDFLGSQLGPSLGPAWAQLRPGLGPGLGPGPELGPKLEGGVAATGGIRLGSQRTIIGPPRKIAKKSTIFGMFLARGKIDLKLPQVGPGVVFS